MKLKARSSSGSLLFVARRVRILLAHGPIKYQRRIYACDYTNTACDAAHRVVLPVPPYRSRVEQMKRTCMRCNNGV